jgi:hypothetical protein
MNVAKVQVLFVYPHGNVLEKIVGEFIDVAEGRGDDPCHAAVFACGGILEAIRCGVVVSEIDRYKDCKTKMLEVDIPNIEAAENEGQKLIGTPYGLVTDCVSGGLHDITGIHCKGNGEKTVNCSETVTRYLRAGGFNVLPDTPADCITPRDLLAALNKEVI